MHCGATSSTPCACCGGRPAFAATAIATLALVIGANTAVFSLAHAILLRPLPYPQPERLAMVEVEGRTPKGEGRWESHDGTTWEVMRDGASAIDVAVIAGGFGHDVNLVVGGKALAVGQARVGSGYFHVLGVAPAVGREFTRDDDRPGGPAVCVISYNLWQRVFSGDAGAIGQSLLLRGERYDVIGVMPKGFENPGEPADVWTPVRPSRTGEGGGTNFGIVARVKDGRTWQEAIAAMPALDSGFIKRVTGDDVPGFSGHFTLVPLQDTLVADVQQPIVMLGGAVFTVLLIACVNLAVLVLVRGGSRTKEIATRMALGGGRRDVLRQLMTESAVLGLAGGALGLAVGYVGLEGLKALGGATFEQWTHVTLDGQMLAFTMGLSLFTCLLFGLVPALQASRLDVQAALAEGGSRSIAGGSRPWLRRILVGAEVALGVVLLVVTALLIRAFVNLRSIDPGFDPTHVVTTSVSLQDARYKTAAQMNQLFDETVRRLEQTPGIESAAVSLELPYRRLLNMGFKFMDDPDDKGHIANVMYVTPDFFQTLRVPLLGGRAISASDAVTAPPIVVVNQGFIKLASGGRDPIGRRVRVSNAEREIVGVVGDVKVTSSGFFLTGMVKGPITSGPLIYLPAAQTPDGLHGHPHLVLADVDGAHVESGGRGGGLAARDRRGRSAAAHRTDSTDDGHSGGGHVPAAVADDSGRRARRSGRPARGDRHPRPDRALGPAAHARVRHSARARGDGRRHDSRRRDVRRRHRLLRCGRGCGTRGDGRAAGREPREQRLSLGRHGPRSVDVSGSRRVSRRRRRGREPAARVAHLPARSGRNASGVSLASTPRGSRCAPSCP